MIGVFCPCAEPTDGFTRWVAVLILVGATRPMDPSSKQTMSSSARDTSALLNLLIRSLVDFPDDVSVQTLEGSQSTIFEVKVNREDVRRVIGRKGRTADAVREILINLGSKAGRRFLLEIVEPSPRKR